MWTSRLFPFIKRHVECNIVHVSYVIWILFGNRARHAFSTKLKKKERKNKRPNKERGRKQHSNLMEKCHLWLKNFLFCRINRTPFSFWYKNGISVNGEMLVETNWEISAKSEHFMLINDVVSSLIARMTRVICSNFRMVSLNKINVYLNNLDNLNLLEMLSYQTISLDQIKKKVETFLCSTYVSVFFL